jgi:hypothetical protein
MTIRDLYKDLNIENNDLFKMFVVSPAYCRGDYGQEIQSYELVRRMKNGQIFSSWRDAEKFGVDPTDWDDAEQILILIPVFSEEERP